MKLAPKANRETKRLNLKGLRRMLLQQRAKGYVCAIDTSSRLGPGIRRKDGSLAMLDMGSVRKPRPRRRCRKLPKPLYPLLTMWQERRLVLLKKPGRLRWIRRGQLD